MSTFNNSLLPKVSMVHFASHFHIMTLPALLPVLPGVFGVGYLELGFAISIFNITSALTQTPMGFAVDYFGAERTLKFGLIIGSSSFFILALLPNYNCLIMSMIIAGLANAVYHPADYSLLTRGINPSRMGRAFSIHTFLGFLGAAVAPMLLLTISTLSGPRIALIASAIIGLFALAGLLIPVKGVSNKKEKIEVMEHLKNERKSNGDKPTNKWVSLLPLMLSITLLFAFLNLSTSAIEKFSVLSLTQGSGITLSAANTSLTAFLFSSAFGVLFGGYLADRTKRHGLVATLSFITAAALTAVVALGAVTGISMILAFGLIGFLTGQISPSRDMLVRKISPKGEEGKTFGIVSTGFNVGGAIGPITFGWLLDHGYPGEILWLAALLMAITAIIMSTQETLIKRSLNSSNGKIKA